MKRNRIVAVTVMLGGLLVLGVAFGRSRGMRGRARPAHTIVYRITSFNKGGNVAEISQLTRYRYSDGSWKSQQTFSNGKTKNAGGDSAMIDRDWAEFAKGLQQGDLLGYRVIIQPTKIGEVWLSPDLDDVLKLVYYDDFEKKDVESIMEAVQIKEGEPPAIELVPSP